MGEVTGKVSEANVFPYLIEICEIYAARVTLRVTTLVATPHWVSFRCLFIKMNSFLV